MRKSSRNPALFVVAGLLLLVFAVLVFHSSPAAKTETLDVLVKDAKAGKVQAVTLIDNSNVADVTYSTGTKLQVHYPARRRPTSPTS